MKLHSGQAPAQCLIGAQKYTSLLQMPLLQLVSSQKEPSANLVAN